MRESKLEKKVCDYAKSKGWLVYKFMSPMNKGVPDRIFIKSGIVVFIEFKAPGKTLTKLQSYIAKQLRLQKSNVYVVDNFIFGKDIVDKFTNN